MNLVIQWFSCVTLTWPFEKFLCFFFFVLYCITTHTTIFICRLWGACTLSTTHWKTSTSMISTVRNILFLKWLRHWFFFLSCFCFLTSCGYVVMFARLRTNDARLYWPNLCKEVWSENVLFVLCSQVTLGVKKLCRRAYGRTINILPLPFAGRPGHIVVHQTPSNGSPIDSVIIYAPLMRLTPVYWLLFACRVTFLNSHTHTRPVSSTDEDYKAVSGHSKHVASLNGITTVEKEKFPKNFWPDVSVHMKCESGCVPVCICVETPQSTAGTNGPTGAAVVVCPLWQQDEINYVRKSIRITLAL